MPPHTICIGWEQYYRNGKFDLTYAVDIARTGTQCLIATLPSFRRDIACRIREAGLDAEIVDAGVIAKLIQ